MVSARAAPAKRPHGESRPGLWSPCALRPGVRRTARTRRVTAPRRTHATRPEPVRRRNAAGERRRAPRPRGPSRASTAIPGGPGPRPFAVERAGPARGGPAVGRRWAGRSRADGSVPTVPVPVAPCPRPPCRLHVSAAPRAARCRRLPRGPVPVSAAPALTAACRRRCPPRPFTAPGAGWPAAARPGGDLLRGALDRAVQPVAEHAGEGRGDGGGDERGLGRAGALPFGPAARPQVLVEDAARGPAPPGPSGARCSPACGGSAAKNASTAGGVVSGSGVPRRACRASTASRTTSAQASTASASRSSQCR